MVKKLPLKLFLETFEYVPRLALDLLVNDTKGKILLTKRAKPPLKDFWHMPGSFLLKNETLDTCLRRIAKEELDLTLTKEPRFLGIFEDIDKDPRGHVIDMVYEYTPSEDFVPKSHGDTKEAAFFDTLPQEIGFNHRETLMKLGYRGLET